MNTQVVYLIRHGSPQYPTDQLGRRLVYGHTAELTDDGKAQCVHLADCIVLREANPLQVLITSPYRRAKQTAEILSQEMGVIAIEEDDRLRDTHSKWQGVLAEKFMAEFTSGKTFDDPRTLETLEDLGKRMKTAYDEIILRYKEKRIGIISHGDPIRALWFRLIDPQGVYPPYLDLTKMVSLGPAQAVRLQTNHSGGIEPYMEYIPGS
jgi:broad specificity phosphatase PhoE